MGRFLTRDTWEGDSNRPISFNGWMYVEGNPINLTDPTGNTAVPPPPLGTHGCGFSGYLSPYFAAVNYVDKSVSLSKSNWLNTYAAAGIAVQCWAGTIQDIIVADPNYSGLGPGQITNQEVVTQYGMRIPNPEDPNDKRRNRGFGLRCYLPISYLPPEILIMLAESCTYCFSPDEINNIPGFDNLYQLEPIHDQTDIDWAVIYMKRRMKSVIDICSNKNCGDTDKFIAAALVQNSPGFTQFHMSQIGKLPSAQQNINQGVTMRWDTYFRDEVKAGNAKDTIVQLYRFNQAIQGLISKNWFVPDINKSFINHLININGSFP